MRLARAGARLPVLRRPQTAVLDGPISQRLVPARPPRAPPVAPQPGRRQAQVAVSARLGRGSRTRWDTGLARVGTRVSQAAGTRVSHAAFVRLVSALTFHLRRVGSLVSGCRSPVTFGAGVAPPSRAARVSLARHVRRGCRSPVTCGAGVAPPSRAALVSLPRHVRRWCRFPVTSGAGVAPPSRAALVSLPRHVRCWCHSPVTSGAGVTPPSRAARVLANSSAPLTLVRGRRSRIVAARVASVCRGPGQGRHSDGRLRRFGGGAGRRRQRDGGGC